MSIPTSLCEGFALPTPSVKWSHLPLLLALALLLQPPTVHASGAPTVNCEISKGACSQKSGQTVVTLDVLPKPVKVMQDLTFTVTVAGGKEYDQLLLDLQMVGMNMGPNRVSLVKNSAGTYTGKGIIPKCHSGMKLWSATVALPGNPAETKFLFNVLY